MRTGSGASSRSPARLGPAASSTRGFAACSLLSAVGADERDQGRTHATIASPTSSTPMTARTGLRIDAQQYEQNHRSCERSQRIVRAPGSALEPLGQHELEEPMAFHRPLLISALIPMS